MMIPSIVAKVLKGIIQIIFFIGFVIFLASVYLCVSFFFLEMPITIFSLFLLVIRLLFLCLIGYCFAWILHKIYLFIYDHEEIKDFE